ncbi:MAG: 30S ribosomal protein S6 [Deltaproteobacteria bacterium]|jgi:small subunit ribosomal protein S6|nr:30S ribosomal protein S6 [Deltaproteobacteria bacterium]
MRCFLTHPRRYETLILLSPKLGKPEIEAFKAKIDGILAQGQGQIVRYQDWGHRRLAYPVNKEVNGNYLLFDYQGQPALSSELERNLKIDEHVFKFLTIVLEKDFTDQRLEETLSQLAKDAQQTEAKPVDEDTSEALQEYNEGVAEDNPDFVEEKSEETQPEAQSDAQTEPEPKPEPKVD